MLSKVRQIIKEVLAEAKNPAVLMSFGKDSMLLLWLAKEVLGHYPPCVWFKGDEQKFAKRMILELDLEVWSWMPRDVYVLPNKEGLSLVREQSFGTHVFPVVSDIEHGPRCIEDFPADRTPMLYPHFDTLLLGFKESDYHWTLGGSNFCPPDGWQLGDARVFALLREMSDTDVWQAIRDLNIPYDKERYDHSAPDPSTLYSCSLCLQEGPSETVYCQKAGKEIPRVSWDREARLREFQIRFGFRKAA